MTLIKLKIKKGDTVKVLSGKDRAKTGKILAVMPKEGKAVVEGLNLHTKFERSKKRGEPGKKVVVSSPMSISKLQMVDPNSGKPTRVGYSIEGGVKQRIAKKSKQPI